MSLLCLRLGGPGGGGRGEEKKNPKFGAIVIFIFYKYETSGFSLQNAKRRSGKIRTFMGDNPEVVYRRYSLVYPDFCVDITSRMKKN